jgi:DNA-directed RNA polymerase subunit RPC12/RpoP
MKFACSVCHTDYDVHESLVDKTIRCRNCGELNRVLPPRKACPVCGSTRPHRCKRSEAPPDYPKAKLSWLYYLDLVGRWGGWVIIGGMALLMLTLVLYFITYEEPWVKASRERELAVRQVKVGMTDWQVTQLLGKPSSEFNNNDFVKVSYWRVLDKSYRVTFFKDAEGRFIVLKIEPS